MKRKIFQILFWMSLFSVTFFFCATPPNPFDSSDNAKTYMFFEDSKGNPSADLSVTDSVGNFLQIGIYTNLINFVSTVKVTILKYQDTRDTTFVINTFKADFDTQYISISFPSIGKRTVTVVTDFTDKNKTQLFITGTINIIGKSFLASIKPEIDSVLPDSISKFSVITDGVNPTYQWYHKAILIQGQTDVSLVINHATMNDSGSYTCLVKDKWGDSVLSNFATLVICKPNTKPTISIIKSHLNILPSDTCSLMLAVTDVDSGQIHPITVVQGPQGFSFADSIFTWVPPTGYLSGDSTRKDSVIFATIDNGIPPMRDTLKAIITVATRLLITKFNVVYNGNGSSGGTVPVDANSYDSGVVVTVKPNSGELVKTGYTFTGWNTATDGSGKTYAAATSLAMGKANDTLFAKWALDIPKVTTEPGNKSVLAGQTAVFTVVASGANLQYQWQKGTTNIANTNSATYTTPATVIADSGTTYRCIVSNTTGADTTTVSTLIVTTQIVAPKVTSQPSGQSAFEGATATFTIVASGTNPQYQWQKGTTDITGANTASYTTPALALADNATTYRCIVSNATGRDTSNAATLAVTTLIIAPKVTTQPTNQSATEGSSATFSIVALGTTLQYQWQKGTTNIQNANSASYTTSALVHADSGTTYRCIVTNTAGKDTSAAATLTVTALVIGPKVTTHPTNQSTTEGSTATFTIVSSGTSPQYQWQRGTTNINGANSATYTTPIIVFANDNGATYRCIVSNSAGKDTSSAATLTVLQLPPAPIITGITTGDGAATVSWGTVATATSYNLYYIAGSTVNKINGTKVTQATSPKAIASLTNGTQYAFAVSTVNANGESILSAVQTATPQVPVPTAPTLSSPSNNTTGTALSPSLSWSGTASTFRLQASTISDFSSGIVFDDSTLTGNSKSIGPLSNNTQYYWRVNGKNVGGTGSWSSTFSFTTIVAAPSAPTLSIPLNNATGIAINPLLSWSGTANTFRLQVSTSSSFTSGIVFDDSTLIGTSKSIGPLSNNTQYYWRMNGKNAGGSGSWSSIFNFTTIIAAPPAPTINSLAPGGTKITVNWGAVNGATSYNVYYKNGTTVDKNGTKIVGSTPFDISGLTYGTQYSIAVSAVNPGGESGLSAVQTTTTLVPAEPVNKNETHFVRLNSQFLKPVL